MFELPRRREGSGSKERGPVRAAEPAAASQARSVPNSAGRSLIATNRNITGSVTEPPKLTATPSLTPPSRHAGKPDADKAAAGKDAETDGKKDRKAAAPADLRAPAFGPHHSDRRADPDRRRARHPRAAAAAPRGDSTPAPASSICARSSDSERREAHRFGHRPSSRTSRPASRPRREQKNEAEDARLKGLITMYENMKPRDAAKIFERPRRHGVLVDGRRRRSIRAPWRKSWRRCSPTSPSASTVELGQQDPVRHRNPGLRPADLPKIDRPARSAKNQRSAK